MSAKAGDGCMAEIEVDGKLRKAGGSEGAPFDMPVGGSEG